MEVHIWNCGITINTQGTTRMLLDKDMSEYLQISDLNKMKVGSHRDIFLKNFLRLSF